MVTPAASCSEGGSLASVSRLSRSTSSESIRLADLEEEHTEQDHGDQHVEGDAQFHHQGMPSVDDDGGEEEPVLHRHEAEHLRHRLACAKTIISMPEQHDREADGDDVAGEGQARQLNRSAAPRSS